MFALFFLQTITIKDAIVFEVEKENNLANQTSDEDREEIINYYYFHILLHIRCWWIRFE